MLRKELELIGKEIQFDDLNKYMMEQDYYNIYNDLSESEVEDALENGVIAFENKNLETEEEIYTYVEFEIISGKKLKIQDIFEM
ncbi:hypothetical protein H5J22_12030 [Cetobacterium sp. 8H]|uniref:hypothetical protein n=1 Tax=Cetobacterium sp. 8H TaxID=2759681 RepID=UPI00163D18FD|nr:hypothetical protein [Cetobacterium sp. 8H]MBC2852127.1 hypothetical protein [Cetobacterium sp. 8H]